MQEKGTGARERRADMKILLAVDGSASSDAAVDELLRRPWPSKSDLRVITVVESPLVTGMDPWAVPPDYLESIEKAIRRSAGKVIENALAKLKKIEGETFRITSEIIQGSPKQVIVEEAESWGADLIVMGSRGLGAWDRLMLGSISSSVVHHAKCSVEVVRR
jgi:nucleotide-binding universal stress UspA family protein